MSVLVNGSPTADFNAGKGLRQGDPLSPFLFLIVVEGLSGLMRKAVENHLFHGYKVSFLFKQHIIYKSTTKGHNYKDINQKETKTGTTCSTPNTKTEP
jgi:hypothetical protein